MNMTWRTLSFLLPHKSYALGGCRRSHKRPHAPPPPPPILPYRRAPRCPARRCYMTNSDLVVGSCLWSDDRIGLQKFGQVTNTDAVVGSRRQVKDNWGFQMTARYDMYNNFLSHCLYAPGPPRKRPSVDSSSPRRPATTHPAPACHMASRRSFTPRLRATPASSSYS